MKGAVSTPYPVDAALRVAVVERPAPPWSTINRQPKAKGARSTQHAVQRCAQCAERTVDSARHG
eukprot:1350421-Prymnesium_polylepis.1